MENEVTGLTDIRDSSDTRGIEWELNIDRTKAAQYGAGLSDVGAAVQMVTNGIKVGEYRPLNLDREVDLNLIYFNHDKKRLQYKFEMVHKTKNYLASTIEILALYVDLSKRKVTEFEDEKLKLMDNFILENSSKFNSDNLVFSDKIKK